jgi:hypothetical protein
MLMIEDALAREAGEAEQAKEEQRRQVYRTTATGQLFGGNP